MGAFLRSITPAFVVLSRCLAFDHACCLPHSAKQDGLRYVAFLFLLWVGIANGAFSSVGAVIGLCGFTLGLRFFAVIPTELRPELVMRKGAP